MSKNYEAIYDLIVAASQDLTFPIDFNWGESSDKNKFSPPAQGKTLVWMEPLIWNGSFPNDGSRLMKDYPITLYFCQKDKQGSTNEDRRSIINDCDALLTEFLLKLDDNLRHNASPRREFGFDNISVNAFFQQTTHILTGLVVDFTLHVADDFEYCE